MIIGFFHNNNFRFMKKYFIFNTHVHVTFITCRTSYMEGTVFFSFREFDRVVIVLFCLCDIFDYICPDRVFSFGKIE